MFKIKRQALEEFLKLKYTSKIANKILSELEFTEENYNYRSFLEKFRLNLALAKR